MLFDSCCVNQFSSLQILLSEWLGQRYFEMPLSLIKQNKHQSQPTLLGGVRLVYAFFLFQLPLFPPKFSTGEIKLPRLK